MEGLGPVAGGAAGVPPLGWRFVLLQPAKLGTAGLEGGGAMGVSTPMCLHVKPWSQLSPMCPGPCAGQGGGRDPSIPPLSIDSIKNIQP